VKSYIIYIVVVFSMITACQTQEKSKQALFKHYINQFELVNLPIDTNLLYRVHNNPIVKNRIDTTYVQKFIEEDYELRLDMPVYDGYAYGIRLPKEEYNYESLIHYQSDKREQSFVSYTEENAGQWIGSILEEKTKTKFAIAVDGKAIGGIGVEMKEDVYSKTMELGYWIGESYWNKGIITEAIRVISDYIFDKFDVMRLEAHVYHWNIGSMRALEKAGFEKEAVLKNRVFKNGEYVDEYIFVSFRTSKKQVKVKNVKF